MKYKLDKQHAYKVISLAGIFMVLVFEHTTFGVFGIGLATIGWTVHGAFWLLSE